MRSIEKAFKRAEALKAAKLGDTAGADAVGVRRAPEHRPGEWALKLLRVTPLPPDIREKFGPNPVRVTAAPRLTRRDKVEPGREAGSASKRPKEVPACAPGQFSGQQKVTRQTIPPDFEYPKSQPKFSKRRKPPSPPHYPHLRPSPALQAPKVDSVTLVLSPGAALAWSGGQPVTASLLRYPVEVGRKTQLLSGKAASSRDLFLGFDFGTSSAKVVLGDRGLKQAYAVPFRDAPGIDAYLLPARLYADADRFSLHGGTQVFADLKLSILANPENPTLQAQVVAYLALAIREARGWYFTTHADSYARVKIVWTLALGTPAVQASPGPLTELFERLGRAAWAAAGETSEITSGSCLKALRDSGRAESGDSELHVIAMPEIAAQIYGFVSSDQFDEKARNIFLVADVGAGTVDSCLFHVVPERGGLWSFDVYTTAVEPNGVMNLHRHRVAWWQHYLRQHLEGSILCEQLGAVKLATDHQAKIPDSYQGYLNGVTAEFSGKQSGPDKEFFSKHLMAQVQGRTLYRAFSARLLDEKDLGNVPFFLCGGGARHRLYRALNGALRPLDNYKWLSAKNRELAIPGDLRADGLARSDYDRLSVAYGLSMLNLDNIAMATQVPRLAPQASNQWGNHYVDKDQC